MTERNIYMHSRVSGVVTAQKQFNVVLKESK